MDRIASRAHDHAQIHLVNYRWLSALFRAIAQATPSYSEVHSLAQSGEYLADVFTELADEMAQEVGHD